MKQLFFALSMALCALALPHNASAQKDKKLLACDMQSVNLVRDSVEKLTQAQVNSFLLAFDSRCLQNIEFSESSNAMLFKLLMNKPDMVIYAIDNTGGINTTLIMDELKEPFLEPDFAKLFASVQAVKSKSKTKSDIIHAISQARSNR